MIKPGEIQSIANKENVRDQQIEKDYILSWILVGISNHEQLSQALVFKGGTVLKKVYFEDYRYSEDLDFSLLKDSISNEQLFRWFKEAFEYILEEANIPLEILDNNEHQGGGLNFYIGFEGPLGGIGKQKSVKVDISRSEELVHKPDKKSVFQTYSDLNKCKLLCYPLEEVLIEKMRCVMQRMQARDLYDIWYLLEICSELEVYFLLNEFRRKCEQKEIDPSEFPQKLETRMKQYKAQWEKSIEDQIQELPEFDTVEREVWRHFRNIEFSSL